MVNYNDWKTKDLAVTSLFLDPLNPRIPEADENLSQRKLIEFLLEHDKVYELAKEIVDKGYFPTEALIGVQIDDKKYIVEGNRRLAALKLLINPDGAPAAYKKKFIALSDRADLSVIKKVKVVLAPSREAAAPMILAKHTGLQVRGWSRIMQAKFYKQLLDDGITVRQLASQYSITLSEIKSFLQLHTMYSIACALPLPADVRQQVLDSREFPASTLERIFVHPKVQKYLGIEFNEDNKFIGKVHPEEFAKGYGKIVTDIVTGAVDTRKLNSSDSIAKYVNDFGDEFRPNHKRKGSFDYQHMTGEVDAQEMKIPGKQPAKRATIVRNSASLIPPGFKCHVEDQRINNVFQELKKLKLATHPNSTGIMLRVLLELSIGYYLEQTKLYSGLLAEHRKGARPKSVDWAPTLKQMLGYLLSDKVDSGLTPLTRKAINKLLNDKNIFSADTLDSYVHNRRYIPTEDQLRSFWAALSEVFELTLTEPAGRPAKP